jgi:hypothetical protein
MPSTAPFVPLGFVPPPPPRTAAFVLEPLGPEHNERDYAAWTSSVEHIRATPGFAGGSWPHEMSLAENRDDLARHANDFAEGGGFTYTVLDPEDADVIGCVYIYPAKGEPPGAHVSSWVRADRAQLDAPLYRTVSDWIEADWPFGRVDYAPRDPE